MPDDRFLSQMSLRIFRAGLKHSIVDAKWPAFEEVFHGFDPRRMRAMSDEELETLLGDTRLIRHWGKLKSVRDNAAAMIAIGEEHGGFGRWLAGWPGDDIVGLWEALAKRFSQMGGNSGPTFLRMVGKDTFILSPSVVGGAQALGVAAAPPKNRKDRAAAQSVLQRLGGRDRPPAVPAEPDPGDVGGRLKEPCQPRAARWRSSAAASRARERAFFADCKARRKRSFMRTSSSPVARLSASTMKSSRTRAS